MPIQKHCRQKEKQCTAQNMESVSVPNTWNTSDDRSNEHNNEILYTNIFVGKKLKRVFNTVLTQPKINIQNIYVPI